MKYISQQGTRRVSAADVLDDCRRSVGSWLVSLMPCVSQVAPPLRRKLLAGELGLEPRSGAPVGGEQRVIGCVSLAEAGALQRTVGGEGQGGRVRRAHRGTTSSYGPRVFARGGRAARGERGMPSCIYPRPERCQARQWAGHVGQRDNMGRNEQGERTKMMGRKRGSFPGPAHHSFRLVLAPVYHEPHVLTARPITNRACSRAAEGSSTRSVSQASTMRQGLRRDTRGPVAASGPG